jgi:hypothetical protein
VSLFLGVRSTETLCPVVQNLYPTPVKVHCGDVVVVSVELEGELHFGDNTMVVYVAREPVQLEYVGSMWHRVHLRQTFPQPVQNLYATMPQFADAETVAFAA